jgi:hypothetical protein
MANTNSMTMYKRGVLAVQSAAAGVGIGVSSYRMPQRAPLLTKVRQIRARRAMLLTPVEAFQIGVLVRETAKMGANMAEVGVYAGASARLIRECDPAGRPLHLFDTFAGLPETAEGDVAYQHGRFEKGQFACSLDSVRTYLQDCENVSFHEGLFPTTAEPVAQADFSFVHSDVDLHESTRSVLEFFYGRMVPGGIILTHDYASSAGVHRVWQAFFQDKREPIIELPGNQAMVVRLGV